MSFSLGIDIGSTSAKTLVLDDAQNVCLSFVIPTGWSSVDTAEEIKSRLAGEGIDPFRERCVATGYGRIAVPYADKAMTEITCHAIGAHHIYGLPHMTVIDIGGQDTKIIAIEDGMVSDFSMNDKCSAGTGRFLEVMANTLGVRPDELCRLAASGGGISISSMCTVFAESEVISLIGRGERKENIAYAVVDSIVRKVASQAKRLLESKQICLTGGLCETPYIVEALSAELKAPINAKPLGRYAGALGAAITASRMKP